MADATWTVPVGSASVTALLDAADDPAAPAFVFAHGAGGNMMDRGIVAATAALVGCPLNIVRFNFPYAERHRRRVDPMTSLMHCIEAVVAVAKRELSTRTWILGGRSMGGRAASMLVADGFRCDGLLLLAYPLHPADHPERLRDSHLPRIEAPVLCVNGTRDALCRQDLMSNVVRTLGDRWTMRWLEGADHSFHVTRASGRTDAEVFKEVAETTCAWLARFDARQPSAGCGPS